MNYHEILLNNDEQNAWEYPKHFDDASLNRDVRNYKAELELVTQQKFDIEDGSKIQDASFHASIFLKREPIKDNHWFVYQVRFSNFGRMVTINSIEVFESEFILTVVQLLEQHNFVYIPANELDKNYDGTGLTPRVSTQTQPFTWWDRYFDYI